MKLLSANTRYSRLALAASVLLFTYLNIQPGCASSTTPSSRRSNHLLARSPQHRSSFTSPSTTHLRPLEPNPVLLSSLEDHAPHPSVQHISNGVLERRSHTQPSLQPPLFRHKKRQLHPTKTALSPSSPLPPLLPQQSLPSPSTPSPTTVSPSVLAPSADPNLPQNQPNVSTRVFPYTPPTGANFSLEITPNVTNRQGLLEIRVGLLLPYSLPNNITQVLSYSGTSAIRLAVSEINANRLIPGAYITLVLKDSFNGHDPENSGAAQAIFSAVSLVQSLAGVSGVIGDVSSALTVQSALLTSRLSIPQCSYSAGSTQLSDKDQYGYFFRTIPTELMYGRVMMDFVASRGWKTIAVFYAGDSLGSQMMDTIAKQALKRNITIGYRKAVMEVGAGSTLDIGSAVDSLEDSGQRIVIVASAGDPQTKLIQEAVKRGLVSKEYVWIVVNEVTEPLFDDDSTFMPTELNGFFMFDNLLKLHGYRPYEEWLDKWAALDPADYPYAGQRDISSNEVQAYSCMMVMANAFAKAVGNNLTTLHLLEAGRLGNQLRPLGMNTNYTGPGGPMVFDENGDVVYGNFILSNFQNGNIVPIGTYYSGVFNLSSEPMYFDGTHNTPADSAPLKVLNPRFGSSIGMVVISVASLSILFSLLTMLIVIVYRNAKVIKASSPLFCCLELCGFILLYIATVMGLDIPTKFTCMARPLALDVGFVLVVSNIVAKNFRIYRIFHNIYVTKRVIRDSHLLKIVGTILSSNLVIMAAWFIKYPPALRQIVLRDFTSYWSCDNLDGSNSTPFFAVLLAYNAALLLIATYLAYKNRNVAANYNECRQIAFVVYNILLAGCLAMPTVFLPNEQFLIKFYLSTVVILFGTTFSLMFLFLPKLWELFTQIERSQQRLGGVGVGVSGGSGGGDGSASNSIDGFIYNGNGGWANSSGNLAALAQGSAAAAAAVAAGSGCSGSANEGSQYLSGRKGSIGTLDESKGETLKETHMGYMGVKFQNRWVPFLSSWCMRRVILYPTGRYFTCFELGKPETGKTFTYVSVFIHSRERGSYILRVIGCSRFDFLFQVRDEERLLYWYSLFDNNRQPPPSNHWSANTSGDGGVTMPLGNLSMNNLSLMNGLSLAPPSPTHQGGGQQKQGHGSGVNPRNESDQTLHGDASLAHYSNSGISSSNNNGMDESMGFSQVSSNYFNTMLNSPQAQQQPYQPYQQHYQALSLTRLGGQGSTSEVIERSTNAVEQQERHQGVGESQSLRGQQSVIDLGTLSQAAVDESDGARSEQRQHERQYI
ncbi:hypothetical protein BGX30_005623 [Mortierella sp. GBA39]|nr:hypothetical protein BGX30_005623 [Mortierella sp. GBA39]